MRALATGGAPVVPMRALALAIAVAGCLGAPAPDDRSVHCDVDAVQVPLPDGYVEQRFNVDMQAPLLLSDRVDAERLEYRHPDEVAGVPAEGRAEPAYLAGDGPAWYTAHPANWFGKPEPVGLALRDCQEPLTTWSLESAEHGFDAEGATPGQGVHVYTAGFWPNGTLFYTNIASVDQSDWPRAGWYEWGGADALPVYVYDQDPSEKGPEWGAQATPPDPLGSATGPIGTPWQYFVTIAGFNAALQGLPPEGLRTVHLAPEEAYTRPGAEEHPLYGDALVFVIKVVEVRERPCPDMGDDGRCQV